MYTLLYFNHFKYLVSLSGLMNMSCFYNSFPAWSEYWETWLDSSPNSPTNELWELELVTTSLSLIFSPLKVFVKTQ